MIRLALALGIVLAGIVLTLNLLPIVPGDWVSTTGTVVGVEQSTGRRDRIFERVVVEFRDAGGAVHRHSPWLRVRGVPMDGIGSKVQVAYDPSSPERSRATSGVSSWYWLAGLPLVAAGAWIALSARREHG